MKVPEKMPPSFQATYTPIAGAGTTAQIKHLATLLVTQLTALGQGKVVHNLQEKSKEVNLCCQALYLNV